MEFKQKINQTNLKYGFLRIDKVNQRHFPIADQSVKITGVFENEDEPVELTYSSKWGRHIWFNRLV